MRLNRLSYLILFCCCVILGLACLVPGIIFFYPSRPDLPYPQTSDDKALVALVGHSGPVTSLVFSSEGRFLGSSSCDKTVKLWEPLTGKVICTLTGHRLIPFAVAFSPDQKTLASGGDGGSIILWNTTACKEEKRLGGAHDITALTFSPDSKTLVSGNSDEEDSIRAWNVEAQTVRSIGIPQLDDHHHQVAFAPVTDEFWSCAEDTIRVWNARTMRLVEKFSVHSGGTRMAISSVSRLGASCGCSDGNLFIWDLENHKIIRRFPANPSVHGLAISPDGALLAIGRGGSSQCDPGEITFLDASSGEKRAVFKCQSGYIDCLAFSPDGKYLASAGSGDSTILIWEVNQMLDNDKHP